MKSLRIDILGDNRAHIVSDVGDGTSYDLHVIPDVYGGDLVIWTSTGDVYRVFSDSDREDLDIKHLNRQCEENKWTRKAIIKTMAYFYKEGGFI